MKFALFLLVTVLATAQAPKNQPADCRALRGAEATQCYSRHLASSDPYFRAEAAWGFRQYSEANGFFRVAVERQPKNPDYRVRWGRLLLERFNKADAAGLFEEALKLQPGHAGALLGLALAASESFDRRAVELAEKALASDPRLLEAHELLARLALEEGDEEKSARHANNALEISGSALDAMAVHAAIDLLNDRPSSPWMDRILKIDPGYGDAYATVAHLFILNRRYEEGIRFYREAVKLNPELWPAHSQLGINLMRLGEDAEARRHLELCYRNGHRDNPTVNTLRLLDSYKNFEFYKADGIILKLHKKEADALRPYFESEIKRAIATYERKYGFRLERPVQVEVYPDHDDFAVRTLGMPGLGALGVAFGYVVAMDSPSARKKGEFHWASTLWHELSHVFVLAATRHRVPRWFTEGLAVHEESAASPDWGDRLTPDVIAAVRDAKLLPVAQLDRGFVRPSYPGQVIISYFQAGRICDYIAETWGEGKLVEMIHAFAAGQSTPEAIQSALGIAPEELDRRFLASLEARLGKTTAGLEDWRKRIRRLNEAARAGKHDQVILDGPAVRDLYPDYVEHGSAYEALAQAYLAKGDKERAAGELERYANSGGRSPELLKKLAGLLEESGRKKEAAEALARLIYVDPLDEETHRRLGDLWLEQGNTAGAIREYSAVIALKPLDPAASHYNLARAYHAARETEIAQEHLLLALEAAPGYRPAQKMLLELNK